AVGETYAVLGYVRSPFEYAATVRGFMDFMADFYRDPQLVHDLIDRVKPATVAIGKALAAAGVDALVIKDSLGSSSVISPDHYREFVFPYEVEAIEEIEGEVPVILHVCRNSTPILADMARTGAAALEVDSLVDLAEARKTVGDGIVLKGNIDAAAVVEKGTAGDVREAVKTAMDAAKADGGFILSTGDSIPLGAPPENVAALVEAGREYGVY
ncbi:MAG: uroporphyrinogen decarboxylase family protein, partial [Actinomycetota bacterium]